jgi:large subunit ribosomal protein L29
MIKVADLRKKDKGALLEKLHSLAKEGFSYRMQQSNGDLKNNQIIKLNRRDIARVKTILNSKTANEQ